jgi:hypothetical protein
MNNALEISPGWNFETDNFGKVAKQKQKCLHLNCSCCNGTGINKYTKEPCIHMISCPCPQCSPNVLC